MTLTFSRTKGRKSPSTMESTKTTSTEKLNPELLAKEARRLGRVTLADFIRGDPRYPERYVFSPDLFPDYSRTTQRHLVAMIQKVCEAQNSPVSVHQWATEEHDDRVVRRIRFRCAFFRKKKKAGQPSSCGFQFQIAYQANYGWCMMNGKGQCRHSGHPLANANTVDKAKQSPSSSSFSSKTTTTTTNKSTSKRSVPAMTPMGLPLNKAPKRAYPVITDHEEEDHESTSTGASCCSTPEHVSASDENILMVPDMPLSESKMAAWHYHDHHHHHDQLKHPLYTDMPMDTSGFLGEDIMEWDLLDETDVPQTTAVSSSSDGLLSKTIHLTKTPFPEFPDLEDKCAGIVEALRDYANTHHFAVAVEDYATVDRPDEKTMRVVLHCLGCNCSYQAALLWVVGRTQWQIYCQHDGIFVHGCNRLDEQTPCSAMAATPLNQALDHLVDFLNGEVVCPDENFDYADMDPTTATGWKEEAPEVSEQVREETHKAVSKVAGKDTSASAA